MKRKGHCEEKETEKEGEIRRERGRKRRGTIKPGKLGT